MTVEVLSTWERGQVWLISRVCFLHPLPPRLASEESNMGGGARGAQPFPGGHECEGDLGRNAADIPLVTLGHGEPTTPLQKLTDIPSTGSGLAHVRDFNL